MALPSAPSAPTENAMALRFDAPVWGLMLAFAVAGACLTLIGVAARAAGIMG